MRFATARLALGPMLLAACSSSAQNADPADATAPDASAQAKPPSDAGIDRRDAAEVKCSPSERLDQPEACAADWFLWDDYSGGPPPHAGGGLEGDNRCYQRCGTNDDCKDPARPFCSILGLFKGGDYQCNGGVRVCRCKQRNDCRDVTQ